MLFWLVIVQKQTPHDIYITYYSQQRNPAFLEVTIKKLGIPSGSVPFLKGTELRNQRRWSVIRAEHSIFTSYLLNNVIKYKHSSYQCVPGSKPDGRLDYQPLFGKMSPHSSPERAAGRVRFPLLDPVHTKTIVNANASKRIFLSSSTRKRSSFTWRFNPSTRKRS